MKHTLKGIAETRDVYLDGEWLDPKPSQKWHNHSPDGFNWGYGGSGPAQLALAINIKLLGHPVGYQEVKWNIISKLPQGKDFEIEFEI
jgi:hypothetical protein